MNAIVDKKTDATVRTQPSAQPGIKNIARPRPTTKPVDTKQAPVSVPVAAKAAVATTTTTTTTVKEEKEVAKTVCSADPAPVAKSAPVVSEPAVEVKEAEPTWAELDAEDIDDPLMVSEYVEEIFEYMRELEIKTMPNPRYMTQQKELQWNMRGILVDWLIDVHNRFQLLPETLFLTVNLIDRFLSQRVVSLVKLQLVGITAMFIASKYEEVMAPSIQNFIYMADDGYKEEEVLRAERYMLQVLDFDLSTPNPLNFLRRISKADDYDVQTRTVAKYLMEIPLVDHRLIDQPWSKISAAAMLLARKMLNRGAWDANFVHYSYYQEEELLDIVDIMEDYLGGTVKHESLYKKYGDAKFFKASRYVREWVRKNVTAGPV
ncbi:cyclin-like protein [Syncephalis fuscata]|nr:cyclin-like protein [Syncephalis fuscata]